MCVDAMKRLAAKFHRLSLTTATNFSNRLVDWLGGFQSGTVGGLSFRIIFPPLSSAKSEKQINLDKKSI